MSERKECSRKEKEDSNEEEIIKRKNS